MSGPALEMPRPLDSASPLAAVLVLSLVWLAIGVATGAAASLLPRRLLAHDTWLTRPRAFEDGGRFYQRVLRINRWKDSLPEAGAFGGGESLAHIAARDPRTLSRFAEGTRRAEYVHWANVAAGPCFFVFLPPWGGAVMTVFALAVHVPFICIQRYNRPRVLRLLGDERAVGPAGT